MSVEMGRRRLALVVGLEIFGIGLGTREWIEVRQPARRRVSRLD